MARLLAADALDLADLIPEWRTSLQATRKSPRTVRAYTDGALRFRAFLAEAGMPTAPASLHREHIEAYMVSLEGLADSTAATHYRNLQQLFNWLLSEGEVPSHPMARMSPPKIGEKAIPVVPRHHIDALLKTCSPGSFEDRRDEALIRLYLATGLRLEEGVSLTGDALDRETRQLVVHGKGNRTRIVVIPSVALKALDRYLRLRRRHPHAALPWLWLGPRGQFTKSGVTQLLRRRSRRAGIDPPIHPHQLRHTWAHGLKAKGMAADEQMYLGGWKTMQMLNRYAASAVGERARASLERLAEGDDYAGM